MVHNVTRIRLLIKQFLAKVGDNLATLHLSYGMGNDNDDDDLRLIQNSNYFESTHPSKSDGIQYNANFLVYLNVYN